MEQPKEPATAQRLTFTLKDLVFLVIGCGVYLAILRALQGFAKPVDEFSSGSRGWLVTFLIVLFWPLPVAVVGALKRGKPSAEVAPGLSALALWRLMSIAYPAAFLLAASFGAIPISGAAQGLLVGMLSCVVAVLLCLGGLLMIDSGVFAPRYPAAHWLGILLYLYLLWAAPLSVAMMIGGST